MFQGYFKDVSRVFQGYSKHLIRVYLPRSIMGVLRLLKWVLIFFFKGIKGYVQGHFKRIPSIFNNVSMVTSGLFHECLKIIWKFKAISIAFKDSLYWSQWAAI